MKLVREIVDKIYKKEECLIEEKMFYQYDSEEEKLSHKKEMENEGWIDSGQIKENIGTVWNPEHVWIGKYYKYKKNNS